MSFLTHKVNSGVKKLPIIQKKKFLKKLKFNFFKLIIQQINEQDDWRTLLGSLKKKSLGEILS
jgi:hypothetical protein